MEYGLTNSLLHNTVVHDNESSDWWLPGFWGEDNRLDGFYSPSRILIIGPSGSGKTYCLTDMLLNYGKKLFMKLYLFSNNLEQKAFQLLRERIFDHMYIPLLKHIPDLNFEDIYFESDNIEDMPQLDEFDSSIRNFIILDDFLGDKTADKESAKLFKQIRHRNATICYLAQRFTETPNMVRENANYICIFRTNQQTDISQFRQKYGMDLSLDEFRKKFIANTNEKYSFLTIDLACGEVHPTLKYRQKFDGPAL